MADGLLNTSIGKLTQKNGRFDLMSRKLKKWMIVDFAIFMGKLTNKMGKYRW